MDEGVVESYLKSKNSNYIEREIDKGFTIFKTDINSIKELNV